MNIMELVKGNHVSYQEMIVTDTEHKLSGTSIESTVIEVLDENSVKIDVKGKVVVANREQLFPIPVTEERLIAMGFIREAGLLKKMINPAAPIKISFVFTPGSDEPFSILYDNHKGNSMLQKIEVKYPAIDLLERLWYKESGGFSIYS